MACDASWGRTTDRGTGEVVDVSTAAYRYTTERAARGEVSRKTAHEHRIYLLAFARDIGDPPVRRLTAKTITRWFGSKDIEASTRAVRFSLIAGFCRWLVRNRYLRTDPTHDMKAPKRPRRVPRNLDTDTVARVFDALPDLRAQLIVSLEVQEMLRAAEVANLQLGDIDSKRRMRVRGKGSKERVVPITNATWELLRRYLDEHPASSGPLIRSHADARRGLAPTYVSRLVSTWMKEAGVKRRPHDGISGHAFRATGATDMLENGANIRNVQTVLGHASLATTQIYLAWIIGNLRADMEGRVYRRVSDALQVEAPDTDNGARPPSLSAVRPRPGGGRATEDMPQSRTNGRAADAAPPNGRWAEPGQPAQLSGNGGPPRLPNENEAPAEARPRWEEP